FPGQPCAFAAVTTTGRHAPTSFRISLEQLVVIVPRHDAAVDSRIYGVRAPTPITEPLIKRYRRTLGVAQVEVEDSQAEFTGEALDFTDDTAAEPAAAGPWRDKGAGQGPSESLRLVVARRPAELC